jgi:nitrite reductase/ring-hydroxylating ferredoxin subunit
MPIATFDRTDLPGGFATETGYFRIEVRGEQIALIDMTCPHRGGPLTHGHCDGEHIVCPWHGGRIKRRKLERSSLPVIQTAREVIFVLDASVTSVFQSIPLDCRKE